MSKTRASFEDSGAVSLALAINAVLGEFQPEKGPNGEVVAAIGYQDGVVTTGLRRG